MMSCGSPIHSSRALPRVQIVEFNGMGRLPVRIKKLLGPRPLNLPRLFSVPFVLIGFVNSQNSQFWWV